MLLSQKVVLVIEQDHEQRVLIRQSLEASGHFVVSAASGSEALNLLRNMSEPALILLNQDLFDFDVKDLIHAIRQDLLNATTPISVLGDSTETLLEHTCCFSHPKQLSKIIDWLNMGIVDSTWTMPN